MRTASLLLTASVACAWSSPIKRNWSQGESDDAVGHAYSENGQNGGDDAVGHAYTETGKGQGQGDDAVGHAYTEASSAASPTGVAGQGQGNNAAGSTLTENGGPNASGGQGAPGSTATEGAGQGKGNNAAGSTLTETGGQGAPGSTATVRVPGSAVPIPSGSDSSNNNNGGDGGTVELPGFNPNGPGKQTFEFLSPTVDFQPAGQWQTSNLDAFAEQGPANASITVAGSGITFTGRGNPDEWMLYVNGTAGDQLKSTSWGKSAVVDIKKQPADHPAFVKTTAAVSGLEYGYYVFTLGSSGNLTFNSAEPNTAGERYQIASANATRIGKDSHVQKEGNWEGEDGILYTKEKGAKLTITVPQATALLELRAGQPPVPFADFRVTISPPPLYGPSVQEFHPNLQSAGISALNYIGNVPIYTTLLNPNFNYDVVVETIGDQDEAFTAHDIIYFPAKPPSIQNGTAPGGQGDQSGNQNNSGGGTSEGSGSQQKGPSPTQSSTEGAHNGLGGETAEGGRHRHRPGQGWWGWAWGQRTSQVGKLTPDHPAWGLNEKHRKEEEAAKGGDGGKGGGNGGDGGRGGDGADGGDWGCPVGNYATVNSSAL